MDDQPLSDGQGFSLPLAVQRAPHPEFTQWQQLPWKMVLFHDADCALCSRWVRWLLARDQAGCLFFCPLQSDMGRRAARACGLSEQAPESLVLWVDGRLWTRGAALCRTLALLGGWPAMAARLLSLIPAGLVDWVYSVVARHRRQWFPGAATCLLSVRSGRERLLRGDEDCQAAE